MFSFIFLALKLSAEAVAKGLVLVNGKVVSASYQVKEGDNIKILHAKFLIILSLLAKYVSISVPKPPIKALSSTFLPS